MTMNETFDAVRRATSGFIPEVGLILGSGLGSLADTGIEPSGRISYRDIPGFPVSTVDGHAGNLIWGRIGERAVLCMQGRLHYYEGYTMEEVTLPVRLLAALGGTVLVVTNAAGGIADNLSPGDLMVIEDHINFLGENPLRGQLADSSGLRFPDMTEAYDVTLREAAFREAASLGIPLKRGVYLACSGPSFETPAEIRAFRSWGASAVGMSTVPETIVARQLGLRVLGISCISNAAAGIGNERLTHEHVSHTVGQVRGRLEKLLVRILQSREFG